MCATLIQCKASQESDQQIILQMVNDARKDSKTISTDSGNKKQIITRGVVLILVGLGQRSFWIKLIYSIHHWINK